MNTELFQEILKKYPPYLTQEQYCELTGKSKSTAEQDRLKGQGAPFIRMGRAIRYPLEHAICYLEGLPLCNSTTEADYKERLKNRNLASSN